jgi:outer membrane lipoprotein SlyB
MYKGTSFWTGVLSGGISQIEDIRLYRKGDLTTQDFSVNTTRNVTGAVGIIAGMEYGAVLGSAVLPGVGTIIGSIVGFMIGNRLGSYAGHQVGNMVFKQVPLLLTSNGNTNLRIDQKN